jgi:hypothetical protein
MDRSYNRDNSYRNVFVTDLLDEEGDGRHFMQESELSVGPLGVRRIAEYPSVQQRAVHVPDHGPDVPRRVAEARLALAELDLVHVLLQALGPLELIRLVERVNAAALRDAYVRVSKYELADGGVQSEAVHTYLYSAVQYRSIVIVIIVVGIIL